MFLKFRLYSFERESSTNEARINPDKGRKNDFSKPIYTVLDESPN
ncbi:MAG: hypothetical protein WC542_13690 [Paludibacter sp.]